MIQHGGFTVEVTRKYLQTRYVYLTQITLGPGIVVSNYAFEETEVIGTAVNMGVTPDEAACHMTWETFGGLLCKAVKQFAPSW